MPLPASLKKGELFSLQRVAQDKTRTVVDDADGVEVAVDALMHKQLLTIAPEEDRGLA